MPQASWHLQALGILHDQQAFTVDLKAPSREGRPSGQARDSTRCPHLWRGTLLGTTNGSKSSLSGLDEVAEVHRKAKTVTIFL